MSGLGLKELGKNTSLTLGRQLLTALLGLLTVILVARLLGPEGNGIYQMVILLPTMIVTFSNLGIGPATVFYVARKDYSIETVIKGNLILGLIISTLACLIALIVVLVLGDNIFPDIPRILLLIIIIVIPVSLIQSYMITIFQGLQDFKVFNIVSIIPQVVILIIVVISLWVLGCGVELAILAYMVGNFVALLMCIYYLSKYISFKSNFNISYIKDIINYGWRAHLSNILAFLNYRIDVFLVNGYLNPVAVGLYSIAVQIAERLWILSQAVSTVLLPRISELKDEEETRKQITPLFCRWVLITTSVCSVFLAIIAPYFIPLLFGKSFVSATVTFQIMLPGIILLSHARIIANDIAARGRPEINMYLSFIAIIVNITGNIILIPIMRINGAALSTTISYFLNAYLTVIFYSRLSKVKWYKTIIPERRDFEILLAVLRLRKVKN